MLAWSQDGLVNIRPTPEMAKRKVAIILIHQNFMDGGMKSWSKISKRRKINSVAVKINFQP